MSSSAPESSAQRRTDGDEKNKKTRVLPLPPGARSFLGHVPKLQALVGGAESAARPFVPPAYRSFVDHFEDMFGESSEKESPQEEQRQPQRSDIPDPETEHEPELEPEPTADPEPEPDPEPVSVAPNPEPTVDDVEPIDFEAIAATEPLSYSQYPLKSVAKHPPWCCCASWIY